MLDRYDVSLPLKAPSAEFQRHEALLKAADVDLTPYQMTEVESYARTAHVQSVTIIQNDTSVTQTFDPPTSLATSAKVARGFKAKLHSWFGSKNS